MTDDSPTESVVHAGVTPVPYTVERDPDRDRVVPSMTADATVVVRVPPSATTTDVEAALGARTGWLLDSLYGLAEGPDPRHRRAFERGEKLLYGGQRYPLRVAESPVETPRVTFDGAHFILRVPRDDASPTARRDAVLDWYRDHARDVIPACAAAVAPADPPPVDVGAPDRRWVCDAGDRLLAHWRLVFLPRPVAAYAVAHALVGRQYDPSAPAFWTALDARVPNARSRGDWLRQNGARLRL